MISRKKIIIITIIIIIIFIALLGWLFIESTKPLPGTKVADEGRGHVTIGTEVKYKTNPPTSGAHYEEWTRAGVFDKALDDRNLVHSLEHGYVILWYKCVSGKPETEASGSAISDGQCGQRKDQLVRVFNEKGKRKLIVTSRANLDANFALTGWDYLDKFNDFDKSRVEKFIDAHLNQGPEATME